MSKPRSIVDRFLAGESVEDLYNSGATIGNRNTIEATIRRALKKAKKEAAINSEHCPDCECGYLGPVGREKK